MITIRRGYFRDDGIFGTISDDKDSFIFFTLEHSFQLNAKVAKGTYLCKKTLRTLEENPEEKDWFWTYEITDVPDFEGHPVTGILFHAGNYNSDSNGCVLLGMGLGRTSMGGKMITDSRKAHKAFMKAMEDVEEFELTIL